MKKDEKSSLNDIGGHLPEYTDYELESIINIVTAQQYKRKHGKYSWEKK